MATRAQYSDEIKELVKLKYPRCRSVADREALAKELGIESLQKLYNLASRLGATRGHENTAAEVSAGADAIYDPRTDMTRLYMRDDPDTLVWTRDNNRYLIDSWRKFHIEDIAFQLNRSETAVAYQARKLRLRKVPMYYDAKKVAAWLGIDRKTLVEMTKHGLVLKPCTDSNEVLRIMLVSTVSLGRVLSKNFFWKELVAKNDADRFFIKDVLESLMGIQLTTEKNFLTTLLEKQGKLTSKESGRLETIFGHSFGEKLTAAEKKEIRAKIANIKERLAPIGGDQEWEANCWVSHGHTSLNPYSMVTFGLFFDGFDRNMSGVDLVPEALHPKQHCASDNWRRENWSKVRPVDDDLEEVGEALAVG